MIPYQIKDSGKDFIRFCFLFRGTIYTRSITLQKNEHFVYADSEVFKILILQAKKYIRLLETATSAAATTLLLSAECTPWENINCKNCFDCHGCVNCENCKNCFDCVNCKYCKNCFNCKNCEDCTSCKNCEVCKYCVNTIDSFNCKYSRNLKKCNHCIECHDCQFCNSCKKCTNCADISHKDGCGFVIGYSIFDDHPELPF